MPLVIPPFITRSHSSTAPPPRLSHHSRALRAFRLPFVTLFPTLATGDDVDTKTLRPRKTSAANNPRTRHKRRGGSPSRPLHRLPRSHTAKPRSTSLSERSRRILDSRRRSPAISFTLSDDFKSVLELGSRFTDAVKTISDSGETNPAAFPHGLAIYYGVLMRLKNSDGSPADQSLPLTKRGALHAPTIPAPTISISRSPPPQPGGPTPLLLREATSNKRARHHHQREDDCDQNSCRGPVHGTPYF